jgi:hypothetical protein
VADYSPVEVTPAGVQPAAEASVTATDRFAWPAGASSALLVVKNDSGGNNTVGVDSQASASDGLGQVDKSVVVAAGAIAWIEIGQAFIDSTGFVNITHSAPASQEVWILYH